MKYISHHWKKEDDGILFFFQRLEEMLFHYSDDIVRAPVHNTRTLLIEYLKNESEVKKGTVKAYQLDPILEELCSSIQTDKILHDKFGEEFIVEIINNIKTDKGDGVRYLGNKIPQKTYYHWCVDYLKRHAIQPTHKNEIEFGVRAWVSELTSYGYSPEYIYTYLREQFDTLITDPNKVLMSFLERFNLEKNNYRVYLSFSPTLTKYKDLFNTRMHVEFETDEFFPKAKKSKKDFVGYLQISALDRYKAAEQAYANISIFLKYYRVISNRSKELVRLFCIVKNEKSDKCYEVPVKSNGYRSIEPEPKADIEPIVDSIIIECQGKHRTTYAQLCKMIDLHNSAISQHDLNDGFLNLWSILEIVSSSIPSESKIDKVIQGVLPILQKDYFHVVFENLDQDLIDNLSTQDYQNLIIHLTSDGTTTNYISRFIFLPEYEQLREEYFEKLSEFPVIRQKIYTLWDLRNSKSQLWSLANRYAQRVKCHIYRLYRVRNAIVHSGESNLKIQALGEHLHIYDDRILSELLIKLANEKTLQTISDVLIDTRMSLSKIRTCFNDNSSITFEDLKILENSYFYSTPNDEEELEVH